MRNAARQLRTEATGNLVFLRDTKMPQTDRYTPFQILSTMGEPERRQFGKEIFERVINYLRILAAEELYPNGVLADQVIVHIEGNTLGSIQLVPKYYSTQPQPMHQIQHLMEFLYQQVALPSSQKTVEFYFPHNSGVQGSVDIESSAKIIDTIDGINLIDDPNKFFICDGKVLSNQLIFQSKQKLYIPEGSPELWIMLARFCNEHEAIQHLELLPSWLNVFIRYDNETPLPEFFLNLCSAAKPLQTLRIVLGMYPEKIAVNRQDMPKEIQTVIDQPDFPIWQAVRLVQLFFLSFEFTVSDHDDGHGVYVHCPTKPEAIITMLLKYE